jgi:hypothetical protein
VQGSIGVLLVDAASNASRSTHLTWMRAVTSRGHVRAKAAPACRSSRAELHICRARAVRSVETTDAGALASVRGSVAAALQHGQRRRRCWSGRGLTGVLLCGGLCRPQPSAPGFFFCYCQAKAASMCKSKDQKCSSTREHGRGSWNTCKPPSYCPSSTTTTALASKNYNLVLVLLYFSR